MREEFNQKLTRFILDFTMPLMILGSVLSQEGAKNYSKVFQVFGLSIAVYTLLPIISFLLAKALFLPKPQQGLYMFMHTFSNIGFMGFPIITALYGNEAVLYTAILNIMFNLCAYTIGILMMNYKGTGSSKDDSPKPQIDVKMILSPGSVGSVLAILVYYIPVQFPEIIVNVCNTVGGITSPLAMLIIGSTLATIPMKDCLTDWRVYLFSFVKQIVIPLLCWPVMKHFIHDSLILHVLFILILMPIGNTALLFATRYELDVPLATKNIFISTILSILTIPLCMMLVGM